MAVRFFKNKFLNAATVVVGCLLLLLTSFHFWFVYHAEQIVEDMVESRSNGKLKLKVHKFKFNWFSYKMELDDAVFYSTDSTAPVSYRFAVSRLKIRVKEILPLIFNKRILIDSLSLQDPDIEVTKWRMARDSTDDKNISIPKEMGKIYNSIQDALQVLQVNRFQIDNGKFTLLNKVDPGQSPITITNLFFHLDNLQVDTGTSKQKILFSDNVVLSTRNQSILFPDGRHRLSFGNFHINIRNRIVEFDSCTIDATKGDSSRSSFNIFFDKLLLTNVDFDTLYHNEVIKADSVYCVNPQFKLNVQLEKRTGLHKTPPKLDELIQQLTGDLQIGHVIVNNGSFDINTIREGRPSSFTSNHNNFKMEGLRIQQGAENPLTVKNFEMAIRNYENYLGDSSYAIQFDSVLFKDNRIFLSNFGLQQLKNNQVVNSLKVPRFELTGLSWDDLVFDQKLTAEEVSLYHPVIDYSVLQDDAVKKGKHNVFETLAGIGDLLELDKLNVFDGSIHLNFRNNAKLNLENADFSVSTENLAKEHRLNNLKHSIRYLNFRKGVFHLGDLTTELQDVSFKGEPGKLLAGRILAYNTHQTMNIDVRQASMNSFILDDANKDLSIDGLHWTEATIHWLARPGNEASLANLGLHLQRVSGGTTALDITSPSKRILTTFSSLRADDIKWAKGISPQIKGLMASGRQLDVRGTHSFLTVGDYVLNDTRSSSLQQVTYRNFGKGDSISVDVPAMDWVPDVASLLKGQLQTSSLHIHQPVIDIHLLQQVTDSGRAILFPMEIGELSIDRPQVNYSTATGEKKMSWTWNGNEDKDNAALLHNIHVGGGPSESIEVEQAELLLQHFLIVSKNGRTFDTKKGFVQVAVHPFTLQQDTKGQWRWKAVLSSLDVRQFVLDSVGSKKGRLELNTARLHDFTLTNDRPRKLRNMLADNPVFRLDEISGNYQDSSDYFSWYGGAYNQERKIFSLDSFYHPVANKKEFVRQHPFQTDYVRLSAGSIQFDHFDPGSYLQDSVFRLSALRVDNLTMEDYRDKQKPLQTGIVRQLPVALIRQLPYRLVVDTLQLNNYAVQYAETNEKNGEVGTVTVARLNAQAFPVKNIEVNAGDSLRIRATAYLMDTAWMKLEVQQSYADTAGAFSMQFQVKPAELTILNPVLIPWASARLVSGHLDTLSLWANGNDYAATGEMKLFYHNLKMQFLKSGAETKRTFLTGLKTFIANSFVIRNKNTSRTGSIYFIRLRDRSAINYMVKIAGSGIVTSVGAKSNAKALRTYKKQLKP